VSFADSAEVFRIEGRDNEEGGSTDESKFVHGQRFTPEEDTILMEAIRDFTEVPSLALDFLHSCDNESYAPDMRF
jgi:hypothetical protein